MKKFTTELLAPAKDKETAIAAINAGADAVYIGASCFGARKNAGNTLEDIQEIIEYAHKFYVKVFVTVNTILNDEELKEAVKLINELYKIKTDAVIIQDMGLVKLAKDGILPPIPLHISTQCNNRTKEKVKFFELLNIPRVVLARELSLKQIKEISEYVPSIELESFIHGALCVSYSGQCYLSKYIGGRSANRGECAQPCRKKYSLCDSCGNIILKDKYLLSLKDFNASKYLKEMVNIGVKSFKIEGRLKDKNYVKNTVLFYRILLDKYSNKTSSGTIFTNNFTPNINKTFNRGYTTYFLNNREMCFNFNSPKSIGEEIGTIKFAKDNYYAMETDVKIHPQDGLCYISKDGVLKGFAVNRVEEKGNNTIIYPHKYEYIPKNTKIFRNQDTIFESELEKANITRKIASKCILKDDILFIEDEDGNTAKVKISGGEIAKNKEKAKKTFIKQLTKTGSSDFYITSINIEQEVNFYPISVINELRRKAFNKLMEIRLINYKQAAQGMIKDAEYPIKSCDYHENIYNQTAASFYSNCSCTVTEFAVESKLPARQIELMRTKHCIKWAINKCKSKENLFLIDEKGIKYPLKFDCKNCEMIILSPE